MDSFTLGELTLEDLLPHRRGMLLLGEIVEVDANHAVTRSTVSAAWPMADAQGVDPLICVEIAAQTAGVCNGWIRVQAQGPDSDQTGWLVAVKRAEFHLQVLPLGSTLYARGENTFSFDKFREVTSQIFLEGRLIAEVTLQLYQA